MPAPSVTSASAPRVASLSRGAGTPRGAARPSPGRPPAHPGRALLVAEVDAEDEAGRAVERQERRRATLLRRAVARGAGIRVLDDEAAGLQLGDERRDRRAREPGQAREVGAARARPRP